MVLDGLMSVAGLSMVYMAAVVTSASTLPRGPAALSAVFSVVALNFFFVPPRGSLAVNGAEYWWILLVLLVLLALLLRLGALLGSLKARRAEAELGRARASELHGLSETMSVAGGLDAMARASAAFLSHAVRADMPALPDFAQAFPSRCDGPRCGAPDRAGHAGAALRGRSPRALRGSAHGHTK